MAYGRVAGTGCLLSLTLIATPLANAQAAPPSVCSKQNIEYYLSEEFAPYRTTVVDIETFFVEAEKARFDTGDRNGATRFRLTTQDKRDGTIALLDYWNKHKELRDDRWLAYVLGTALHETAFTMNPVRETLASTDDEAVRRLSTDANTRTKSYWKAHRETGHSYFGRGYVQITWDSNYQKADLRLGRSSKAKNEQFYHNPALALERDTSTLIAYDGIVFGWFSGGNCLLRYFMPDQESQWKHARRTINVEDKWKNIGIYSEAFLDVIRKSTREAS